MIRKNKDTPDITFLDPFDKQLKNAPDEMQEAFLDTLELFLDDPHHPQLRNHELREKFAGLRSIGLIKDEKISAYYFYPLIRAVNLLRHYYQPSFPVAGQYRHEKLRQTPNALAAD